MELEMTVKVEVDTGVQEEIADGNHVNLDPIGDLSGYEDVSASLDEFPLNNPSQGTSSNLHSKHSQYKCRGEDRMERHVRRKHGQLGIKEKFQCQWCEYSTMIAYYLKKHELTHTGRRDFKCQQCDKTFSRRYNLKIHAQAVHEGLRPHICDVCNKSFTWKNALVIHKRIHTGVSIAQCEKCGRKFNDRSGYIRHMRLHDNVKPYQCGECSTWFSRRDCLTTHMRRHSGVKPYQCGVCSARFSKGGYLKEHMRTHTGERPYSCPHCKGTFCDARTLKNHVISKHTHEYKLKCMYCSKGYVRSSGLRRHSKKCLSKANPGVVETTAN